MRAQDGARVEAVEQKRPHLGPQRRKRGLQDDVGDGLHGVLPLPTLMTVDLLQMIEVMLQTDRVVEASPHVHEHPPLARQAIEQRRQVRHVGEIRRHLHHEQREVDVRQIGREVQRRQFPVRRAEDDDLMALRLRGNRVLVDRGHTARPRVDTNHQEYSHQAPAATAATAGVDAANSARAQRTVSASPARRASAARQPSTDSAWPTSACTLRCSPGRTGARLI